MDKKKYFYIYKITILTGRLKGHYYIGKRGPIDCLPEEDINYNGSGIIISDWFKKERIEGIDYIKEIIHYCKDEADMNNMEILYIGEKYKTDTFCMNLMAGGHGGRLCKESLIKMVNTKNSNPEKKKETYRKISEKRNGNPEKKAEIYRKQKETIAKQSSEKKDEHYRKVKDKLSKRTPEQKAESNRKRQETINKDIDKKKEVYKRRGESKKATEAKKSPEEKAEQKRKELETKAKNKQGKITVVKNLGAHRNSTKNILPEELPIYIANGYHQKVA